MRYTLSCFVVFLFQLIFLFACQNRKADNAVQQITGHYKEQLVALSKEVTHFIRLVSENARQPELLIQFKKTRLAYKNVEWLAEYYYPYTAKMINGPALAEVEADEKSIVVQPEGFQVIEEMLPHYDSSQRDELLKEAKIVAANIGRLIYLFSYQEMTDAHIFDALHLEIFRITTLGITGFDSPILTNSLVEAGVSLEAVQKVLCYYDEKLETANKNLFNDLQSGLNGAVRVLYTAQDFDSFDRMQFIRRYLNPIAAGIVAAHETLEVPFFDEPRMLDPKAPTLFASNIFNPDGYVSGAALRSTTEKVSLGRKLFYDGILSGDGQRSCATCHQQSKGFTDGMRTSVAVDGRSSVRRNAPTLINAALQTSMFYDMRVNYLEDQAKDVINNKDEMHGSIEKALAVINRDPAYRQLFQRVYNDQKVTETHVKNAVASYVRSLIGLGSRFDQFMRGDDTALTRSEIDGFNIFTGKAKCATCHFIPLFNGNNPPTFTKTDAEVIGVPATADSANPMIDSDNGKYNLFKIELHRHAFKTPTIRNVALTAPYMHNGVFQTLEEVVEFYNAGGGRGWGLELSNQTLPDKRLNLTQLEKKSLVDFMKALTDTVSFRPHTGKY